MRLFEVKFITKDTRLGNALVALEGIAYGKPEITPIRGAKVSGNSVRETGLRPGSVRDAVAQKLQRSKITDVTRRELAGMMEALGANPDSVGSLVQGLKGRGVLKGKGTGQDGYKVVVHAK